MSSPTTPPSSPVTTVVTTTSAPPRPPKIPPPPNLDPPPYTPFSEHAAPLLPSRSSPARPAAVQGRHTSSSSGPRVVRPPGLRRYTQYLTKRNCIVLLALLGILVIGILAVAYWLNSAEEDSAQINPLTFNSRSLAKFHIPDQRISYDENSDSVILSKYLKAQKQLKSEKLSIEEYDLGFLGATHDIDSDNYDDCMRFTDNVFCCSTSPHSRHHKTDCWLKKNEEIFQSHAAHYSFSPDWQSLADSANAVILHNSQRHAILHVDANKLYQIQENKLPEEYKSVGFFFPMDTVDELDELVRSGQEFKICDYLLSSDTNTYILKEEECKRTRFMVEFELPYVKFCSNPLYDAVLQYGHLRNDDSLSWHLRVKFYSSEILYDAKDTIHSPVDQVTMDCNNEVIDLYVLGGQQVIEFSVELPRDINPRFRA
jgi:hypothetical protein